MYLMSKKFELILSYASLIERWDKRNTFEKLEIEIFLQIPFYYKKDIHTTLISIVSSFNLSFNLYFNGEHKNFGMHKFLPNFIALK